MLLGPSLHHLFVAAYKTRVVRGLPDQQRRSGCLRARRLLHRGDQNYDEAIKCYKNARRIERDNMQILRDPSHLQARSGLLLFLPFCVTTVARTVTCAHLLQGRSRCACFWENGAAWVVT